MNASIVFSERRSRTDVDVLNRTLRFLVMADMPADPNSGAAGTVYYTSQALKNLGHEVDSIWSGDLGRRIRHGNLHSLIEQPRTMRRAVLAAVAAQDYDVVLMSQPQSYLAAKALKLSGFKGLIINRSHGVELRVDEVVPEWHRRLGVSESRLPFLTATLRRLLQRQWGPLVRNCDGFVVGSTLDREYLINQLGVARERVAAVPHGVQSDFLEAPAPPMTDERLNRLLYVGQHAFIKGVTLLPEIANRVLRAVPDATFTIVSSRSGCNEIRNGIDEALRTRVECRDWAPQRELREIYDRHGTFVFPSFFEGFGKAPAEAMARGMCVVSSDEGGMRDIIKPGESGELCPVGDVGAFAEAVERLLAQPARSKTISSAAANHAKSLTWTATATGIIKLIENLQSAGR
jgi:glycosyltransferase involved in cell wall biosynthesis